MEVDGDLRPPTDDIESLAYVVLYLLMGDLPWRMYAPYESTKSAMIRTLTAKQAFNGLTIPVTIPVEFRTLLDLKAGLAEMRVKMQVLASNLSRDQPT